MKFRMGTEGCGTEGKGGRTYLEPWQDMSRTPLETPFLCKRTRRRVGRVGTLSIKTAGFSSAVGPPARLPQGHSPTIEGGHWIGWPQRVPSPGVTSLSYLLQC